MREKRLPKSIRTFLRHEKARIRKSSSERDNAEQKIKELVTSKQKEFIHDGSAGASTELSRTSSPQAVL